MGDDYLGIQSRIAGLSTNQVGSMAQGPYSRIQMLALLCGGLDPIGTFQESRQDYSSTVAVRTCLE